MKGKGGRIHMIEVRDVVKAFDGFKALDGLNMHVEDGAVYGLVGPNGAGKSTIMRHLTGIYRQDKGDILIEGEQVYENPKVKGNIAYIPDELFFFPQASINDMRKYYAGLYPHFDNEMFERLGGYFPKLDKKMHIRRMSKGMRKQAFFWLSICTRPKLFIMDEPVDGLDPVMRKQIWSILMSDVAESGMTVLVSSHNLRELEDVCDHIGIIHEGKLLLEKSFDELQDNICKIQVAFDGEFPDVPESLPIVYKKQTGRVYEIIIRAPRERIEEFFAERDPVIFDTIPLTLEEIFIYEMGGVDYEFKNILF